LAVEPDLREFVSVRGISNCQETIAGLPENAVTEEAHPPENDFAKNA
jgi:hypothetical protein